MLTLINDNSNNYQFVFADSPISGGVWWADPPGGKGEPTTDPEHANISISYLDQIVKEQGPFYGIIGYSQGGARQHYIYQKDLAISN